MLYPTHRGGVRSASMAAGLVVFTEPGGIRRAGSGVFEDSASCCMVFEDLALSTNDGICCDCSPIR